MARHAMIFMVVLAALASVALAGPGGMRLAQAAPAGAAPTATAAKAEVPEDALLLVLDAFSIIRMLDNDAYTQRREEVARNLLKNLIPFLRPALGLQASGGASSRPTPKPPAAPVKPPTATTTRPSVKPPSTPTKPKPAASGHAPAPGPAPSAVIPPGHENDPAYAKVPQKARIRAKFRAAEAPFKALREKDPERAKMIQELFSAARTAMTKHDFDTAEGYVDQALKLLGVEYR